MYNIVSEGMLKLLTDIEHVSSCLKGVANNVNSCVDSACTFIAINSNKAIRFFDQGCVVLPFLVQRNKYKLQTVFDIIYPFEEILILII